MYNTMKRLWDKNHDIAQLRKAVAMGWITVEQMNEIMKEDSNE